MGAACCGDRCGFKNLLANGAFFMLSAVCGFGSCRVNDPLAGAVNRRVGLVAALALMPVVSVVILPIRAVAVGMGGGRSLIGGLELHIITGHGEGGSIAALVSQRYAACLNDPLVKDLVGLRCVCRNGDLNALYGAGDGGACGNSCRAASDGNCVILQGGNLGVLVALSMAAGAFLVLFTGLIQRRLLIHYPYPGMIGGFGVGGAVRHLADSAVTAVFAVFIICPRRELVGLDIVAVACRALLIVIAGIQIQARLTGVVMLVICIQSNAVNRIGVGEDGQIVGVVCIQLILGNGDGDGSNGGRRGHTADGNGQCSVVAVRIGKLLDLGGQTCGQVEPGGNIVACRNIFKAVAVHADDHILRQGLAALAADGHIIDGGGVSPGVGGRRILTGEMLYIIQSIWSFRVHILKGTGIEGDRSEFIYSNTRLRIVCRPRTDAVGITGLQEAVFHLHAIQGRGCQISRDTAGVGHALRGDGGLGQGRIGILGKGSCCQRAPHCGICGSVRIIGSCLDGGGLRQLDMLGIRVGIFARGAGLGVFAVGGVGDFKDFLTGVQGVGSNYFDFPDELRSVSGGKLHLGSLRPVDPADHELVAGELLTVCRHNDGIDLCHLAALFGNIHRDGVSGVDKEVTAGGYGGVALLQLPFGDGCGECDGGLAAVIHLRPAVDGLLSERNLLESGVHFHITVRHNKGCFLLGHIREGHAGGIRIPPGEHHVVGGVIFRLHGNGFPGDCRGGVCRASAVRNRDTVRHGCGGCGRRFAHHQLDDMLVAENADGAAVLIQIQLQIKGIDRRLYARRNGIAIFGGGSADGNAGGGGFRADCIAIEIGSIAIACVFQLLPQRIPLELEGMRLVVGQILNGALPVLGVVDGVAVQRDGLHAPCVGDEGNAFPGGVHDSHVVAIFKGFSNVAVGINLIAIIVIITHLDGAVSQNMTERFLCISVSYVMFGFTAKIHKAIGAAFELVGRISLLECCF